MFEKLFEYAEWHSQFKRVQRDNERLRFRKMIGLVREDYPGRAIPDIEEIRTRRKAERVYPFGISSQAINMPTERLVMVDTGWLSPSEPYIIREEPGFFGGVRVTLRKASFWDIIFG